MTNLIPKILILIASVFSSSAFNITSVSSPDTRIQIGAPFRLMCTVDSDYELCSFRHANYTCDFERKQSVRNYTAECSHYQGRIRFLGSHDNHECGVEITEAREEDDGQWVCAIVEHSLERSGHFNTEMVHAINVSVATTTITITTTTATTTTTTTEPSASTTEPAASTMEPAASTMEPAASTTEPQASTMEPAASTTEPAASTMEPAASTTEPAASTTEPPASTTEPVTPRNATTTTTITATTATTTTMEPSASTTEPAASTMEPAASTMEPAASTTEPEASTMEPAASTTEPAASTMEPTASTTEPVTPRNGIEYLRLNSSGVAGLAQPHRMGLYQLQTPESNNTYSVYKQVEGGQFIYLGLDDSWRVGPNTRSLEDTGLKTLGMKPVPLYPPADGWQVYDGDWIPDPTIQLQPTTPEYFKLIAENPNSTALTIHHQRFGVYKLIEQNGSHFPVYAKLGDHGIYNGVSGSSPQIPKTEGWMYWNNVLRRWMGDGNIKFLPTYPSWSSWSDWSSCSRLCGGGNRTRDRTCFVGEFLLNICVGDNLESSECNSDDCPEFLQDGGDCTGYSIDNLPSPRIMVLGPTKVGKSTLSNFLLGVDPASPDAPFLSSSMKASDAGISWRSGPWLGAGECFTVIDTPSPGIGGRDHQHAASLMQFIKDEVKSIDVFLLLFNAKHSILTPDAVAQLKLYENVLGRSWWENVITLMSHWSHSPREVRLRRRKHLNETVMHKRLNEKYKSLLNVSVLEIPTTFIDPVLPVFVDEDEYYDYDIDEREMNKYLTHSQNLLNFAKKMKPFTCMENCKSPEGYYTGQPLIQVDHVSAQLGEQVRIQCKIFTGHHRQNSHNITWTHDGDDIYRKVTATNGNVISDGNISSGNFSFRVTNEFSVGAEDVFFSYLNFTFSSDSMGEYRCENGIPSDTNVVSVVQKTAFWSQWSSWSSCSQTCGGGNQTRMRECTSQHYWQCMGQQSVQKKMCNTFVCVSLLVSLVGGAGPHEGNVIVVNKEGYNGPVCDDTWDSVAANIVCRELGFPHGAVEHTTKSRFGPVNSLMAMDDVRCLEEFEHLHDCPHNTTDDCDISEGAGVICRTDIISSSSVMADDPGKWGTTFAYDRKISVESEGFFQSKNESNPWIQISLNTRFPLTVSQINLFNRVDSNGDRLRNIEVRAGMDPVPFGFSGSQIQQNSVCGHFAGPGDDGGEIIVKCDYPIQANFITIQKLDAGILHINEIKVNPTYLVGGNTSNEGNVVINGEGKYGPICDDAWSIREANVVCKELGFSGGAETATRNSRFGNVSMDYAMDDVSCDGNEARIEDCTYSRSHDCAPKEVAGVICKDTEGQSRTEGSWGNWTSCSASCGGGTRTRQKICESKSLCPRVKTVTEPQACNTHICPRDSCFEHDIFYRGLRLKKRIRDWKLIGDYHDWRLFCRLSCQQTSGCIDWDIKADRCFLFGDNNYGRTGSSEGCRLLCQHTYGCSWFNWDRKADRCFLKTGKGNGLDWPMPGYVTGPGICPIGTIGNTTDWRVPCQNPCRTKSCRASTRKIKSLLDTTVDPCYDFHKFACGRLNANDKKQEINQPFEYLVKNAPPEFNFIKKFYKSCLDAIKPDKVKDGLNQEFYVKAKTFADNGKWPVIVGSEWDQEVRDWFGHGWTWYDFAGYVLANNYYIGSMQYMVYGRMNEIFSTSAFFSPSIDVAVNQIRFNEKRDSSSRIHIVPMTVPQFLKDKDQVKIEKYRKIMKDRVKQLGAEEEMAEIDMERVLTLEIELAEITEAKYSTHLNEWKEVSLTQLSKLVPSVPWVQYINKAFNSSGVKIERTATVLIPNEAVMVRMGTWMDTLSYRDQANLIMWRMFAKFTSNFLNDENWNLDDNTIFGEPCAQEEKYQVSDRIGNLTEKDCLRDCMDDCKALNGCVAISYDRDDKECTFHSAVDELNIHHWSSSVFAKMACDDADKQRSENCLQQINTYFPNVKDDLYIALNLDKSEINDIKQLFESIKVEFEELIHENNWMDPKTKRYAIEKLKAIKAHVGEPNLKQQNMKELTKLITDDKYIENIIVIGNYFYKTAIQDMNKPKDLFNQESVSNAWYNIYANEIQINTGLLKDFGYNIGMPRPIIYGGCVGTTLGHELTHGFDNTGKLYGQYGNLFNWWEEPAEKEFEVRSQCLINQYNNFKITHNGIDYSTNGTRTLGENIADNGGIKLGHRAFMKYLETNKEKCLPNLDFTPKQLFWIGWAQDWCNFNYDNYDTLWEHDVHAPHPWRVNTVFSNMPQFAEDFNCPAGAKLNPEARCTVW